MREVMVCGSVLRWPEGAVCRSQRDGAASSAALADDDELCMSFVSYAELLNGAEGSMRKPEVLRRLEGLVRQVPVLLPTGAALRQHHASQAVRLKTAGKPIGANDLWIACHALAEGAVLVTHIEAEFKRLKGLRVENWAR